MSDFSTFQCLRTQAFPKAASWSGALGRVLPVLDLLMMRHLPVGGPEPPLGLRAEEPEEGVGDVLRKEPAVAIR